MSRVVSLRSATVIALLALVGCDKGDSHNRQAVSGTASIDGKLIPYGNIEFVPADGQPTTVSMEIKDGKFAMDRKGGLAPGKYIIRIQGFDGPPPPPADNTEAPLVNQPKVIVPAKFNSASKETAEVKVGDKNEFTFALKN